MLLLSPSLSLSLSLSPMRPQESISGWAAMYTTAVLQHKGTTYPPCVAALSLSGVAYILSPCTSALKYSAKKELAHELNYYCVT